MPLDRPTKEEIAELPRWAVVAFAARCARRALSLYTLEDRGEVARAVELAENCAANAAKVAASVSGDVVREVYAISTARILARGFTHANAATAAANAVNAAASASATSADWAVKYADWAVKYAADTAVSDSKEKCSPNLVDEVAEHTRIVAYAFIRDDFDRLKWRCDEGDWDDSTGVPPSVFSPLEDEERVSIQSDLLIEIDHGNAPPEKIAEILLKLDEWYRIRDGRGLSIKPEGTLATIERKGYLV